MQVVNVRQAWSPEVWNAEDQPAFDPAKAAAVSNVVILRNRIGKVKTVQRVTPFDFVLPARPTRLILCRNEDNVGIVKQQLRFSALSTGA
jgi:hypothetical protein